MKKNRPGPHDLPRPSRVFTLFPRRDCALHPGMVCANVVIRSGRGELVLPAFSAGNVARSYAVVRRDDIVRFRIIVDKYYRLANLHARRLRLE